jgi:hypothetical protein
MYWAASHERWNEAGTRWRPMRGSGEDVEDDGELGDRCREEESPSDVTSR